MNSMIYIRRILALSDIVFSNLVSVSCSSPQQSCGVFR